MQIRASPWHRARFPHPFPPHPHTHTPPPSPSPSPQAVVRRREDASSFDPSRLVDYDERLAWRGPAVQLTPLVRERGQMVVSAQRVYFQPLHNVAGGAPVRSHPLAAVAAVARRRSALQPIGLELFFVDAAAAAAAAAAATAGRHTPEGGGAAEHDKDGAWRRATEELSSGPLWDQPSAFFTFRWVLASGEMPRGALGGGGYKPVYV